MNEELSVGGETTAYARTLTILLVNALQAGLMGALGVSSTNADAVKLIFGHLGRETVH